MLGVFVIGVSVNRIFICLAFSVFLTACSSTGSFSIPEKPQPYEPNINFSQLYLRGVFNWWEANPAYQFTQNANAWYVDVELIADGQPYDFRISDAQWTPSQSCGAKYKGQPVMLESTLYLTCAQSSENLQFTPSTTGIYRFTIAPANQNEISLFISKQ